MEIRGKVICKDIHTSDYWCLLKNINLNNTACGICATFRAKEHKSAEEEFKNIVTSVTN